MTLFEVWVLIPLFLIFLGLLGLAVYGWVHNVIEFFNDHFK